MAQLAQNPSYAHVSDFARDPDEASQTFMSDEDVDSDQEAGGCLCFRAQDDCPGNTPVDQAMAHVRLGFVRKVYGILVVQLLLTIAIAAPFCFVSQQWILDHIALFHVARWASLGVIVCMSCCCKNLARRFPTNYALLFLFTACEAVMIGFVTARYQTESVLLAGAVTVAVFLGLSVYAFYTKTDFTGFGPYLFAVLLTLCLWGFIALFFPMGPLLYKVYAAIGTLLFCCYIVLDTQLIIGGRHKKFKFEVDDYVFAALNLYLDIVNLFLFILSLLGKRE